MIAPLVIKIGGSTLGSTDTTYADIAAMAAAGDVPVIVHGGGAEASRWLEAMGIPSRFERGLRVTDERVLPVVVAVFTGLVNKRIVTAINGAGGRALGLSGADGRLLECRIADPALGFVGEPVAVHPEAVIALREARITPVISSVGYVPGSGPDQLVNVNADTVAGNIAAAIGARALVFLTDVEGVRGPDGLVPELPAATARAWIEDGTVSGG
ncbi:MAG: acetylglutamate kinase, partial [Dehalococcoidia bacterium]